MTTSTAPSAGREIRCPNTLFVGDFYQARTETVKVVRAARALMVDKGWTGTVGSSGTG